MISAADPVSLAIFEFYRRQILNAEKTETLSFSALPMSDSAPVLKTHEPAIFIESLNKFSRKKICTTSNFRPDRSANMTFGASARLLRLLHCDSKKAKLEIKKSIHDLEALAFHQQDRIYWPHFLRGPGDEMKPFINLGLPKGIGGPIAVLSICYKQGIEKKRCLKLISGAINTILWIEKSNNFKALPAGYGYLPYQKKHSLSWMYGDMVLGYVIVQAGLRCKNDKWIHAGKRIFKRGSQAVYDLKLKTCNFMFGGAGLAHLAFRFHQMTRNREALKCAQFLLGKTQKKYRISRMWELREFKKNELTPNLLNSGLGVCLVSWHHEGLIDARWDSIFALSNPCSGELI